MTTSSKNCALCGAQFATEEEWRNHDVEAVFVEKRPSLYSDDMVFRIPSHPDKPLIVVREPHYEGGGGDDGQRADYYDEGWEWENGTKLTDAEKEEVEDWIMDLVTDNL